MTVKDFIGLTKTDVWVAIKTDLGVEWADYLSSWVDEFWDRKIKYINLELWDEIVEIHIEEE